MSQLFGMNEDNNIGIRVNDIKANNVYQKNEITGEYERISSGGSGPGELPYYLKSNTIDIDSGTNGSELSATGLTIGDSSGNYVLDKTKLKMLDNLKIDVMDPALGSNIGPFLVGFNKNLNLFQRISSFILGNNNTQTNISDQFVSVKNSNKRVNLLSDGISLANNTIIYKIDEQCFKASTQIRDNIITPETVVGDLGNYIVSYNKSTDVFERAININIGKTTNYLTSIIAGAISVSFGTSKLDLFQNKLRITFGGIVYELSKEDIDSVNKLRLATLISPTEANKMIVFDPVTKLYNYATIPAGSTLPSYIQPNRIKFENDSSNYMELQGNSYIKSIGNEGTDTFGTTIQNGKIVLNDYFDPFTTPTITLQNNKITFDDAAGSITILDQKLLKNIPKRYKFTVPGYLSWKRTNISPPAPNAEINIGSDDLVNFPLRNIGDTVFIDMTAYGYTMISNDGLIFTCDCFEDFLNPNFEIKYSKAGTFTQTIIKAKSSTTSQKIASCYIGISGTSGNFNGILSITLKESVNHPSINVISGWPADVIPE